MEERNYIKYEYMNKTFKRNQKNSMQDLYLNLGWEIVDEISESLSKVNISFRRDRKIKDKNELVRLQKKAEKIVDSNVELEKSKKKNPSIFAYIFGSVSILVMGGGMSIVMVDEVSKPLFITGVAIGVLGITLCIFNYFIYSKLVSKKTKKVDPLIIENEEKLATICEQGQMLINYKL